MAGLEGRGIRFESYDLPGLQTADGIAAQGDNLAAWLEDSEGNLLTIAKRAS